MEKKVSWNDFASATQKELKKTYKLDDRGLEVAFRKHLDGADASSRRREYDVFYKRKD
jgi:hypothetical protein